MNVGTVPPVLHLRSARRTLLITVVGGGGCSTATAARGKHGDTGGWEGSVGRVSVGRGGTQNV